jgi:hypothetical protein
MKVKDIFTVKRLYQNLFEEWLYESYSNFGKTLLQDVMLVVDKNIDKAYPTSDFWFKKRYQNTSRNYRKEKTELDFWIHIIFSSTHRGGVERNPLGEGFGKEMFNIYVNTGFECPNKESAYAAIAHEVTHISQKFNNAMDYDENKDKKEFMARKGSGEIDPGWSFDTYYGNVSHMTRGTEKEASLIGVFELLKRGYEKEARGELVKRAEYFNVFDNKTFMKKAKEFGVDEQLIKKLTSGLERVVENRVEQIKKIFDYPERFQGHARLTPTDPGRPNAGPYEEIAYMIGEVIEILPTMRMLGVKSDIASYLKSIIIDMKKNKYPGTKDYNFDAMLSVFKKLNY